MHFALSFLTLASVVLAGSLRSDPDSIAKRSGPSCTVFKVPIKANAQNRKIILPPNFNASSNPVGQLVGSTLGGLETVLGNVLGDLILTEGVYNINMQYCVPEVKNKKRAKTLQCEYLDIE